MQRTFAACVITKGSSEYHTEMELHSARSQQRGRRLSLGAAASATLTHPLRYGSTAPNQIGHDADLCAPDLSGLPQAVEPDPDGLDYGLDAIRYVAGPIRHV